MSINNFLHATFQDKEYQPQYLGNIALFNYPCDTSYECSPISINLERGTYLFELWGAQGGDARLVNSPTIRTDSGGKGAFVSGIISFPSKTNLYLYWWKRRRSKCHN